MLPREFWRELTIHADLEESSVHSQSLKATENPMRVVLFLLAVLAAFASVAVFKESKSALHEVLALELLMISSVLLTGSAIVEAVRLAGSRIEQAIKKPS